MFTNCFGAVQSIRVNEKVLFDCLRDACIVNKTAYFVYLNFYLSSYVENNNFYIFVDLSAKHKWDDWLDTSVTFASNTELLYVT